MFTISTHNFITLARNDARLQYEDGQPYFSNDGLEAIAKCFEESGVNYEYDPVSLSVDFSEYDESDLINDYESYGETAEEIIDGLQDKTFAVPLKNGSFLIQTF